jgi:hypothetical protein
VKNGLKAERRVGLYLGSAFGQISALCDLARDKEITCKVAQSYLKAYRSSHKMNMMNMESIKEKRVSWDLI